MTDRQTDTYTHKTDTQTNRHTQTDTQTNRHTDRDTHTYTQRRQTHTKTDTHTQTDKIFKT